MDRQASLIAQSFNNLAHSLSHMVMVLYPTAVLGMTAGFGLSYGEMVALATPGLVLYGVAALPAGWLGDRWSAPGMMAIFFLGTGAATLATGFARTPFEVMLGLAAVGLFSSIYHPVGIAWLISTAINPGRALGINGIFGSIGIAAGPLFAGFATDWAGWRWAFIVPGLVGIAIGLGLLVALRRLGSRARGSGREDAYPVARGEAWRALGILAGTTALAGMLYQSISIAMPKVFDERVALLSGDTAAIGATVAAVYLASSCSQLMGGWLADRFDLKWVYVVCNAAVAPLVAGAGVAAGLPVVAAVFLAISLSICGNPAENAMIARFAPERWRSVIYGAKFVLALGVSGLVAPLAIGYFDRTTGTTAMLLYVLGATSVVLAALALMLPPSRQGRAPQPALAD
ncbi:MAG: MFS transporter [Alphaproteobacteria bacterium]|nr:MFS transporter [Alphaproteobacteria bacterium]